MMPYVVHAAAGLVVKAFQPRSREHFLAYKRVGRELGLHKRLSVHSKTCVDSCLMLVSLGGLPPDLQGGLPPNWIVLL